MPRELRCKILNAGELKALLRNPSEVDLTCTEPSQSLYAF